MASPCVCVLLPARNAAATVEQAVRSVLAQTRSDLELLAVDDASTDGTGRALAALSAEDPRVRVVRGAGAGLVAALNLGLAQCHAPYVARMDADDESLPTRLALSVDALEADPSLAGVGTGVELFRDDRPVSPNLAAFARWLNGLTTPERLYADRLVESPLCHPAVTLRRAALLEAGGWRDTEYAEDWDLWLRLLERGWRLKNLDLVLFRWRDHDQRLTRVDARYALERHQRLRADHLARTLLPPGSACRIWGAGRTGLSLARLLRARGVAVERFIELDPRKVGQRIDGTLVVSPREVAAPEGPHLLAAVSAKGAREQIRAYLKERGFVEGAHFTCAA